MQYLQSLSIGTIPQWGMFVTLLTMLAGMVTVWIKGIPARLLAKTAAAEQRVTAQGLEGNQFISAYQAWRDEVHGLRDELSKSIAASRRSESENHRCNNERRTLIYLLIQFVAEAEGRDPKSILAKQAREALKHMSTETDIPDPTKSLALSTAEHAVSDAKQTLASTAATCEEVKRAEGEVE